jgi:hypothetical protein
MKEIINKSIIFDFDDSSLIYLDWNKLSLNEINSLNLSKFDIVNIPYEDFSNKITNYYCSFFDSSKSKTGVIGMFINKDKEKFLNNNINKYNFK